MIQVQNIFLSNEVPFSFDFKIKLEKEEKIFYIKDITG